MGDEIDKLILELKENREIKETIFSNTFLNSVGQIYEIYGYGAAKLYLLGRMEKKKQKKEAKIILNILNRINSMGIPREIGSFIIRKINSIRMVKDERNKKV